MSLLLRPIVGIDLGTTFSAIAYINEHGRPETLLNSDGQTMTPSAVMFEVETHRKMSVSFRNFSSP